jgi:hypothetical protein
MAIYDLLRLLLCDLLPIFATNYDFVGLPTDMRFSAISTAALPLTASAVNIVLSNDDGWAEINVREFYYSLNKAGFNVVLSAPAENESGTGSSDAPPTAVGSSGCEFNSCPPGSPAYGRNASMPRFNV